MKSPKNQDYRITEDLLAEAQLLDRTLDFPLSTAVAKLLGQKLGLELERETKNVLWTIQNELAQELGHRCIALEKELKLVKAGQRADSMLRQQLKAHEPLRGAAETVILNYNRSEACIPPRHIDNLRTALEHVRRWTEIRGAEGKVEDKPTH